MRRIALVVSVFAVVGGAVTPSAGAEANPRASCLGSLSSFGGPNHLRAEVQHIVNEFFDQGAFISRAAQAHLGSDPACGDYAFGG